MLHRTSCILCSKLFYFSNDFHLKQQHLQMLELKKAVLIWLEYECVSSSILFQNIHGYVDGSRPQYTYSSQSYPIESLRTTRTQYLEMGGHWKMHCKCT